jgi:hypothetical protein
MDTSYLQFEQGYRDLVHHIEYMEENEKSLHEYSHILSGITTSSFSKDFIKRNYTNQMRLKRGQFAYNISIITLYGLFEQFIEGQLECFVKVISSKVKRYSDLPTKLIETYPILSLKFAQKNLDDKYKDATEKLVSHSDLIKSLNATLDANSQDFTINSKVFSVHSSNFRYDLIHAMFSDIGLDRVIERTIKNEVVSDFYKEFFGLDESSSHREVTLKITEELLDLVQRRNRIAHGVTEGDMLAHSFVMEKVIFINTLCMGIYEVCQKAMNYHFFDIKLKSDTILSFGKPAHVFSKVYSFGFSVNPSLSNYVGKILYVGQTVYLEKNEDVYQYEIETIHHNNTPVELFEVSSSSEFCIVLKGIQNVNSYCKYNFFLDK